MSGKMLSLVIFGSCGRRENLGNKWNNRSSVTILWDVHHPVSLVWLVVESIFFKFQTGTFHSQCIIKNASVRTEWGILCLHYFHLSFHNPLYAGTCNFYRLLSSHFFFSSPIMFIWWMFHLNSIKFPFHLVLGAPPPILAIHGNILLWFIDTPWFNIVKYLNISIFIIISFSFGACIGSVNSYSLDWCKEIRVSL